MKACIGLLALFASFAAPAATLDAAHYQPQLVADIVEGDSSFPENFVTNGTVAYFRTGDASISLWRYTGDVIEPATDLYHYPAEPGVVCASGAWVGNMLYDNNYEAFASSGGTPEMLIDPSGPDSSSYPYDFARAGDRVIFSATTDPINAAFTTDCTPNGTTQLETSSGVAPQYPFGARTVGSKAFFAARANGANHLFVTDGTNAGTRILSDMVGSHGLVDEVDAIYSNDSAALIPTCDEDALCDIWRADTAGASVVATNANDFLGGTTSSKQTAYLAATIHDTSDDSLTPTIFKLGSTGAVSSFEAPELNELYNLSPAADGAVLISGYTTELGTVVLKFDGGSLTPLLTGHRVEGSVPVPGSHYTVLVTQQEDDNRDYLWITDGTAEGTVQIGSSGILPNFQMILVGHKVLLQWDDGTHGAEPYTVDVGDLVNTAPDVAEEGGGSLDLSMCLGLAVLGALRRRRSNQSRP